MPGARLDCDLWIYEYMSPFDVYAHGIRRVLVHERTAFQEMAIVESGPYGKALVLDGKWQSSTGDEFLYHEPLVHVPCLHHGTPRRVLVLGGAEGATVREVLKWRSVEQVTMVDIDGGVVEACRKHLPEMHQGAFDDPRTRVVIGDAFDVLDEREQAWDVIISDLSDPIEEGPSFKLFTREYFERCRRALHEEGTFVVQAGPIAPPEMGLHVRLARTVAAVFPHILSYASAVPTYASAWGFVLGSGRPIDTRPDPGAIDARLAADTTGPFRMLDGRALLGLMQPPKYLRDAIDAETRIYTLGDAPTLFGKGSGGGA